MKVELLSFPGCPSAAPTRDALLEAMRRVGVAAVIEEVDTTASSAPAYARGWPSPTVLIDGVDLEDLDHRDDGASCRLYGGRGVPSLELLEHRLRQGSTTPSRPWHVRRKDAMGIGALVAALAASACCIGPILLAALGVTSMGFLAYLDPWRPVLLGITAVLVVSGLWAAFRPSTRSMDACGCPAPRSRRTGRVLMVLVALVAGAAVAYPWLSARNGSTTGTAGGRVAATRGAEIAIKGITCPSCAETITRRLVVVPGVAEASVDLDRDVAIVRYDPRTTTPAALVAAVSAIPSYSAELLRGDLP